MQANNNNSINPYKAHLDELFGRIIELRHTVSNINSTLNSSVKNLTNKQGIFLSGSALVISDWTGPTDNGWEINFHTGFRKITITEDYENEVKRVISQECCYAFAQSFEALEKFLKDCVFQKTPSRPKCLWFFRKRNAKKLKRESLSGDKLFKMIKQTGDPYFSNFSSNNNKKLKFKELWTILSECRHSITHSKSIVALNKIKRTDYHFKIFKSLFLYSIKDENSVIIELDLKRLTDVLDTISEFAFQVFKSISQKEGEDWVIAK